MIWAILALLGVPLWLCALGILSLVMRNRQLPKRLGDMLVRVHGLGRSGGPAVTRSGSRTSSPSAGVRQPGARTWFR